MLRDNDRIHLPSNTAKQIHSLHINIRVGDLFHSRHTIRIRGRGLTCLWGGSGHTIEIHNTIRTSRKNKTTIHIQAESCIRLRAIRLSGWNHAARSIHIASRNQPVSRRTTCANSCASTPSCS